jgi:hypothetical protein
LPRSRSGADANNTIEKSTIESVEPSAIAVGSPTAAAVTQRGVIQNNTILHARDNQLWSGIVAQHTNVWRVEGNFFDEASNPDATSSELLVVDGTDWRIVNSVFHRPGFAAVHLFDDGLDGDGRVFPSEQHDRLRRSIGRGIRLRSATRAKSERPRHRLPSDRAHSKLSMTRVSASSSPPAAQ